MKRVIILLGVFMLMADVLYGQALKPDSIITTYESSNSVDKQIFEYDSDVDYIRIMETWRDTLRERIIEKYRNGLIHERVIVYGGRSPEVYWEYDSNGRNIRIESFHEGKLRSFNTTEYKETDSTTQKTSNYYYVIDTISLQQRVIENRRYDNQGEIIKFCVLRIYPTTEEERETCETYSLSGDTTFIHKIIRTLENGKLIEEHSNRIRITQLLEEARDTSVTNTIEKWNYVTIDGDTIKLRDRETNVVWNDEKGNRGRIVFNSKDIYTMTFFTNTIEATSSISQKYKTAPKYHPSIYWRDVFGFDNTEQVEEDEYEYGDKGEIRTHKNWILTTAADTFRTLNTYYYNETTSTDDVVSKNAPNVLRRLDERKKYFLMNGKYVMREPLKPIYLIECSERSSRIVLFIK